MTAREALEFISSVSWQGSRPGLERISDLMGRLGDPQKQLRFIHVAGTNGKGSVCALTAQVLTAAGHRTGLFTSPHLQRFHERTRVDGAEISDQALADLVEEIIPHVEAMEQPPTEFELSTALALLHFHRKNCDFVVLEVGLGGRLDSTNVIPAPLVAVITKIGLEHTELLGDTLAQIAREKAGILKPGCLAVFYPGPPEVESVYEERCRDLGIPLRRARFEAIRPLAHSLEGQRFSWLDYPELELGLLGGHQLENAVVALEALLALRERGISIPDADLRRGLADAGWPARFQVLCRDPLFLLDGAHNPQCVQALAENLRDYLPAGRAVFLMGVLGDKDYPGMVAPLLPYADAFFCLTPDSPRALPAGQFAAYLQSLGVEATACENARQGIEAALKRARGGAVVSCGSLYLAGEVMGQFSTEMDHCKDCPADWQTSAEDRT